jgi:hypothetical protein
VNTPSSTSEWMWTRRRSRVGPVDHDAPGCLCRRRRRARVRTLRRGWAVTPVAGGGGASAGGSGA